MSLKTLAKSLELLDCFTSDHPIWGVRDLAKKLGMHHSVVHRIVSTYEQHGFLIQNRDTQKYHLGLKLLEYGKVVTEQLNIQQYFQPILKEIANSTGESVYLNMLEGKEGVCVSIVLSSKDIQYLIPVGDRSPLYAGASQKVMMAYLSEELQEEIIQEGLRAVTSRTITDPLRLRAQLAQIKEEGWCISVGEYTEDVVGISVPMLDSHRRILGSITIAGPRYRIDDEKCESYLRILIDQVPLIRQSCNIISHMW
ncbi:IclR family transcriptional regulator [Paenibacillus dendritiformis]|uniref:IclR family transcriptional regulator domain-containing protein n=1 Tax=Paenibacillus dendritiformis TaxID=130049 RepID=UPI00143DCAC9|nr:IclR family transcriptional regulator [Paenibacillus dendritiformis]NRG01221.1 IclR family transcriptional regulator [Paenibacillus dendritiformis]